MNKAVLALRARMKEIVPFNIAQYALLTHMYAHVTGHTAHELFITLGDAHIYTNHVEALREQITRDPRPLPKLEIINPLAHWELEHFNMASFRLHGYDPHPHIRMDVSV